MRGNMDVDDEVGDSVLDRPICEKIDRRGRGSIGNLR